HAFRFGSRNWSLSHSSKERESIGGNITRCRPAIANNYNGGSGETRTVVAISQ
ncbi:hypothetical protein GBAR_LOCUS20619, partial [Geodia barretti]